MKCPFCSYEESKVIDSRPTDEGEKIRRRRECLRCNKRFTTYEMIETLPIIVVKRDKNRQTFDRSKLLAGIDRACYKRPIPAEDREKIVNDIEQALQSSLDREVSSARIGEMVMDRLRALDEVAYVRFASVYRQFRDINTFMDELNRLIRDKDNKS
ncbi:MAG TPA: transcriptional regulator NrdR [Firmicutes bacterium]|nr:transcriptional regulator NrdR [Bacillota bacterium]